MAEMSQVKERQGAQRTAWDDSTSVEASVDEPWLVFLERRPGAEAVTAPCKVLKNDEMTPWDRLYQQAQQAQEAQREAKPKPQAWV